MAEVVQRRRAPCSAAALRSRSEASLRFSTAASSSTRSSASECSRCRRRRSGTATRAAPAARWAAACAASGTARPPLVRSSAAAPCCPPSPPRTSARRAARRSAAPSSPAARPRSRAPAIDSVDYSEDFKSAAGRAYLVLGRWLAAVAARPAVVRRLRFGLQKCAVARLRGCNRLRLRHLWRLLRWLIVRMGGRGRGRPAWRH